MHIRSACKECHGSAGGALFKVLKLFSAVLMYILLSNFCASFIPRPHYPPYSTLLSPPDLTHCDDCTAGDKNLKQYIRSVIMVCDAAPSPRRLYHMQDARHQDTIVRLTTCG